MTSNDCCNAIIADRTGRARFFDNEAAAQMVADRLNNVVAS
jgi:hypothetical protein